MSRDLIDYLFLRLFVFVFLWFVSYQFIRLLGAVLNH